MKKINEGLRVHDLIKLVLPVISIDEYESKIDPDAIVVGFFVDSEAPANDLSNFIEKGAYNVLDTEVSPSTDDNGNYVVFIELLRDEEFPTTLDNILKSIECLTAISKWKFTYYGGKDKIEFNKKNIRDKIRFERKNPIETKQEQEESFSFFKNSLLDDVNVYDNHIILKKQNISKIFEKIALGNAFILTEQLKLNVKPLSMDFKSLRECNSIRKMLGDNWDVNKIDNHFIISNDSSNKIMVVKLH